MNADQAKFLVEYFARMIETEVPTTAKVIAAVPEDRKDYKPDEKSRSAWDLAKHLATADVSFLDGIIKGAFAFDEPDPPGLNTVEDLVTFYNREMPAKLTQLRGLPAEKIMPSAHAPSSTIAGSSPRTCARWAARSRQSTAGAPTNRLRRRRRLSVR